MSCDIMVRVITTALVELKRVTIRAERYCLKWIFYLADIVGSSARWGMRVSDFESDSTCLDKNELQAAVVLWCISSDVAQRTSVERKIKFAVIDMTSSTGDEIVPQYLCCKMNDCVVEIIDAV